jgi:hypothetical protein
VPVYTPPVEQEHPQVVQQVVATPAPATNAMAKLNSRLSAAFN